MSNKNILLTRAARHIALPQIGEKGQKKIERSTILIIGIGGIGCAASSYLASSGVGHIILCDFDIVDETNLGRQILYGPDDVGKLKTLCATKQLKRINPNIKLSTIPKRLDDEELITIISNCNVVLDCSDNFSTRFQINSACVSLGKYLISGSAIRFKEILDFASLNISSGVFFFIISVLVSPGAIALTLILYIPTSRDKAFACAIIAAFAEE